MEKRSEHIIQVVAITVLVIGCLLVLRPFLATMVSAAILCFSTWPAYNLIERKLGGRRGLAALAMTMLMILLLVLPLALIAATYMDEIPALVERLRVMIVEGLPEPPGWVASIPLVGEAVYGAWHEMAGNKLKLAEVLTRIAPSVREVLVQVGIIIGDGVLQLTLLAFIGYFFYRYGTELAQALRTVLGRVAGNLAGHLLEIVGGTLHGVVYGIVGTGLAQGVAAFIGFLIAGVPGAPMLGFITFFLSIIPVGPPLLWIGATIWLFSQGQQGWAVFMAVWGFFVVSGIDNIVKPWLISRGANLPFVVMLLGVFGGILTFGFVGIFLGPTLLAVGYNLARRWAVPPQHDDQRTTPSAE